MPGLLEVEGRLAVIGCEQLIDEGRSGSSSPEWNEGRYEMPTNSPSGLIRRAVV